MVAEFGHALSRRRAISLDTPVLPRDRTEWTSGQQSSTFGDDLWDLRAGIPQRNVAMSSMYIDFTRYDPADVELIKAYAWCGLRHEELAASGRIPIAAANGTRFRSISPSRLKQSLLPLLRYLRALRARGAELDTATKLDNESWLSDHAGSTYDRKFRAIAVPLRLAMYADLLPARPAQIDPWGGEELIDVIGAPDPVGENKTPRIPRNVIDPLLRWSLFLLSDGFGDLLELIERDRLTRATSLPGTHVPWLSKPLRKRMNAEDLVVGAAYVVTAYLSGMRDGEVQSLKHGCAQVERASDGSITRHRVVGTSYKANGGYGAERTWIVTSEVHLALARLEEFHAAWDAHHGRSSSTLNGDLLFRLCSKARTDNVALASRATRLLQRYQAALQAFTSTAAAKARRKEKDVLLGSFEIALGADGSPWQLMTRQFRRTIAWYIANEPFGIVAGMRQFGHIREVTFAGYAGSAEARFRDEIERARMIGQQEDIISLYEHVRAGGTLGGVKGSILASEFRLRAAGKVVSDDRLKGMLKNAGKNLYPGLVSDCFFDAKKALCSRTPAHLAAPVLSKCDWSRCANSCTGPKHLPMLRRALEDAQRYRGQRGLSRVQRRALDDQIQRYRSVISEVAGA